MQSVKKLNQTSIKPLVYCYLKKHRKGNDHKAQLNKINLVWILESGRSNIWTGFYNLIIKYERCKIH